MAPAMILLLNPLLEGLEAACHAAANAISNNDVRGEALGGGARVSVAKDDFRILKVICGH
jgi:hypothetical protein